MNNWFLVKVKYTKQLENGTFKRVSEPYLLGGMTFTDAEARVYEELGSIIHGEFVVVAISRVDFHDIFHYDDSDLWFKCRISYDSQDADNDKAKKVSQSFLVSARNVNEADLRLKESLSMLMVDFDVKSVIVSPIVDIFPYSGSLYEKRRKYKIDFQF